MISKRKKILFQKNKTIKYDEYLFNISQKDLNKRFFIQVITILKKDYNKKVMFKAYLKSKQHIFPFLKIKIVLKKITTIDFVNFFLLNINKYKNSYIIIKSDLLILRIFHNENS